MKEKSVTRTKSSKEVRNQRESIYGSPADMQRCVALHWTALLRSAFPTASIPDLPPRLVGLMMTALKIHRAAAPFPKKDRDSYLDGHNYLDFAEEADSTLPGN